MSSPGDRVQPLGDGETWPSTIHLDTYTVTFTGTLTIDATDPEHARDVVESWLIQLGDACHDLDYTTAVAEPE